jgi:phage tail sheath protein FI
VRVEASDEVANTPRDVQKHAKESSVVVVDNTPPVISELALNGRKLRLRVTDGVSNIARVEVAVDGRNELRPVAAADGIFDSSAEVIDDDLTTVVPPGAHVVTVRAYDAAGNATSREVDAK